MKKAPDCYSQVHSLAVGWCSANRKYLFQYPLLLLFFTSMITLEFKIPDLVKKIRLTGVTSAQLPKPQQPQAFISLSQSLSTRFKFPIPHVKTFPSFP